MKKKKLILEWDEVNTENYILGIVSSSSHLKLVHHLNNSGYFNLERAEEMEVETNNEIDFFICFLNNDPENSNFYTLIKNKGTPGNLSKEFKGIDYILVSNSENSDSISTIKEILIQQKLIQAVIEINIHKLSDKTKKIVGL